MNETPNIPPPGKITNNGRSINYRVVDTLAQAHELDIEVENPANQDEVHKAISDRLQERYWFLSDEYARQTVRQRFEIELAEGVKVGIYNFQERDLLPEEIATLSRTLAIYYTSLKDKSLWTLESIQIEKQDRQNPKSGEPYRGIEVPEQRRFKLYPDSFAMGNYRGTMKCNWLEGSVAHETTHVTVEPALRQLWEQQKQALGWRDENDVLIELPSGLITNKYNQYPSRIPSWYGSLQPDDDRAECVVQWLAEPARLDQTRADIISQLFDAPNPEVNLPTVRQLHAELPKLDNIIVSVTEKPNIAELFIGRGATRQGPSKPVVPIETFLQDRGIV